MMFHKINITSGTAFYYVEFTERKTEDYNGGPDYAAFTLMLTKEDMLELATKLQAKVAHDALLGQTPIAGEPLDVIKKR